MADSEGAWLSTLPSIGSEAVDAQVDEANLTELEEDALEGAAATEGHAGLPSPDTSPQPRRLGKLPELKPERKVPGSGEAMKKWKATFQLTTAIKKGATLRGMVQLSQLGKVRAAEAPKESPVTLKSLAKRVSDASQHSGRGSVSGPPNTAPGAVSASQKTARQGTGLDVPPPIFGLNGHGQNGLSRASAVKDITAGAPRTSKAQAEENDGNFAATYPSALARKMANVLQKLKDQGEDVSMSTALSSRRPKEGAERLPATAPGENWRDPLGESFAEVKLPGFKGAWPAPKSAEAAAPAISELGALPPMEATIATALQGEWWRSQRRPSEGIRAGAAPGTGLVELELSARRHSGRQNSSSTGVRGSLWQMDDATPAYPSSASMARPSVFKESLSSSSKWKALNLRKVKERDAAAETSQGRRGSLELQPTQPSLPPVAQTDGFSKWKGLNLQQLKETQEVQSRRTSRVSIELQSQEDFSRQISPGTSSVPLAAVPVVEPPSVKRMANALVEHFGSLARGFEHFDFGKKGKFTRPQFYAGCASVRLNFKSLSGLTVREIYKRMDEVDPATPGQVTLQKWNKFFANELEGTEEAELLTADHGSAVERRLEERRKERNLKKVGEEPTVPVVPVTPDSGILSGSLEDATQVFRAKNMFLKKLLSKTQEVLLTRLRRDP